MGKGTLLSQIYVRDRVVITLVGSIRNDVREAQRTIWAWILWGNAIWEPPHHVRLDDNGEYTDDIDLTDPLSKLRHQDKCQYIIVDVLGDYQKKTRRA